MSYKYNITHNDDRVVQSIELQHGYVVVLVI